MSSEKTYLLEGRPYEVLRARRILSPHFQTGWFATQTLYVRVPEEKMGLLRQFLKPFSSLRIRELADGAKYRSWAKEQVKKYVTSNAAISKSGKHQQKTVKPEEIWPEERCAPRNFRFEGAYTNLGVHRSTEWRQTKKQANGSVA